LPNDDAAGPAIPLARWADRRLRVLAELTGSEAIAKPAGATLLAERAALRGFTIPGRVSSGGGSRLLPARGGWFALTISRPADRELLPALFQDATLDPQDDAAIAGTVAAGDCRELLARGRELGLAVAAADEVPASPAVTVLASGERRARKPGEKPLVVDLSGVWAGPLAGHLLGLAGADVVKVESRTRPDAMREGDPGLFALVNQGKASVALDFSDREQKAALLALIRRADIVIEAARPRALLQLGIDADALVRERPGLVWLTITGHGATGEAASWIGIGHDCGVAGGLSRALAEASGEIGFVGDALPDPLTGITAAIEAWRAFRQGEARRIGFALSAVAAQALREERAHDAAALEAELRAWRAAEGQPFPHFAPRAPHAEVRPFGADTQAWLGIAAPC
jgi:hypothetical protein